MMKNCDQSFVVKVAIQANPVAEATNPSVDLTVYFESLCPDSIRCVVISSCDLHFFSSCDLHFCKPHICHMHQMCQNCQPSVNKSWIIHAFLCITLYNLPCLEIYFCKPSTPHFTQLHSTPKKINFRCFVAKSVLQFTHFLVSNFELKMVLVSKKMTNDLDLINTFLTGLSATTCLLHGDCLAPIWGSPTNHLAKLQ